MTKSPKTKTPKTKTAPKTLITMLLDRSGSMSSIKTETLAAINGYLSELRPSESKIRFSLVQFDTDTTDTMHLEKTFVATPIKDVPELGVNDFHPRGMTPLLDAISTTIHAVEESLQKHKDVKCVFVIQTDGHENASKEATWDSVKALISEKTAAGWEFLFMGAGLQERTYTMADSMGVTRERTLSYGKDLEQTRAAFAATASNIRGFSEGTLASAVYSDVQKRRSGDMVDAPQDQAAKANKTPARHQGLPASPRITLDPSMFPNPAGLHPTSGGTVDPGNSAAPYVPDPIACGGYVPTHSSAKPDKPKGPFTLSYED